VLVSEWVVVVFVVYLAAVSAVRPISGPQRARFFGVAVSMLAVLVVVASLPPSPAIRHLRTWLPLAYAILCYWLAGFFFTSPQEGVERWFLAFDRRTWPGQLAFVRGAPRVLLEYLELAYIGVYAIVPAGLAAVILAGRPDLVDRFWSSLLLSVLACYAVLPWVRTRPPWALRPSAALAERPLLLRRANLYIVHTASTEANTFPSGHAAGPLAVAIVVTQAWPAAGVVFIPAALSVAIATVVGDYHYIIDALIGIAVALVSCAAVIWAGV
jgi:hypothetical protein